MLDICEELTRALVERPAAQPKDDAVFAKGYDPQLDELSKLKHSGRERMTELETRLRVELDISTLKVRFTRVFGWYVEVTRAQSAKVPKTFRRKQTVAAGERYTYEALDELSEQITSAEEKFRERQSTLLDQIVSQCGGANRRLQALSERVAAWDVASALAEVAHRYDYTRPMVDESSELTIVDGRHPVVERLAARGKFVPNDIKLDIETERLWLITGPNMAGKSTLLRQVALTCILAQAGSFVPAASARIGLIDRVLSRVGANDDVARGESTFMVEMRESAEILRSASKRSLVILDEIGRGTSTYDGLAIAWAVAEYLDSAVGCRALFATHYHELTELASRSRHVENYSVTAKEVGDDIVFLHRLVPGAASRSYGIAVAKLAGLPQVVIARAKAVLALLEKGEGLNRSGAQASAMPQLDLFAKPVDETSARARSVGDFTQLGGGGYDAAGCLVVARYFESADSRRFSMSRVAKRANDSPGLIKFA